MPQTTIATNPYNITPGVQTGQGAYGGVPGRLDVPPSMWEQVQAVYPGLSDQSEELSRNINAELMGELSPSTISQLQQHAAEFGARSGMPLSQLVGQQGVRSLGMNVEALQRQGQQDYLSALTGIGQTMTPQSLLADIANRNATMAAAPDPMLAAQEQMRQWQNRFNATQGLGSGGRGGTTFPTTPAGGTGGAGSPAGGNRWYPGTGVGPTAPAGQWVRQADGSWRDQASGRVVNDVGGVPGSIGIDPRTGNYILPGGDTFGGFDPYDEWYSQMEDWLADLGMNDPSQGGYDDWFTGMEDWLGGLQGNGTNQDYYGGIEDWLTGLPINEAYQEWDYGGDYGADYGYDQWMSDLGYDPSTGYEYDYTDYAAYE